ncbi:DUF2169 family type VI secretion system accessory protein [Roseibium sediminicola]|uniref:DUF2169 domain-containing protein n=1 Tax=Roseibium sediminicola TaxID=2933272 RepID=A0ABT0GSV7_9HYPH|nr:DUF2169 domain-containing protein [Roseibium sp. CAU 1639]MCK7611878.1 DUF2169 domain-containing protein [Roseibium sp. CAU 1639]
MPGIVKPSKVSAALQPHAVEGGSILTVSAFLLFDVAAPYKLLTEQALWPMVAEQMPDGGIFDKGQLKPRAEMIVAGHALAPGDQPVTGLKVTARLGTKVKRLAVFGDRVWRLTDRGVEIVGPQPFDKMPISELRAFGGQGHKSNPKGKGHKARQLVEAGLDAPLPNIERADTLILSPDDTPPPAHFGPIGADNPQRLQLTGTYDRHWQEHVSPCRPDDYNPLFHCDAPEDQRLESYFAGGEVFSITGMSRSGQPVEGTLPEFRMRGFVHRPSDDSLTEMALVCDTLTLFPNVEKAVLTFRGVTKSTDRFADDVGTVMLAVEHGFADPRPPEHYHRVFRLRTDPDDGYKHALSDFQLMPETDPAHLQAKREERLARARAERDRFLQNSQWFLEKTLQDQGLPAELAPPSDTTAIDDVPLVGLPTSEELANGDFDLAELIDEIEQLETSLTQKAQSEFARAGSTMRSLQEKLPENLRRHLPEPGALTADPAELDLDPEMEAALASEITPPDAIEQALQEAQSSHDCLGRASDLDALLSDALTSFNPHEQVSEEAIAGQCELARARAFRLTGGGLLHPVRQELDKNNPAQLDLPDFVEDRGAAIPEHAAGKTERLAANFPDTPEKVKLDFDPFAHLPESVTDRVEDTDRMKAGSASAMNRAAGLLAELNPSLAGDDPNKPLSNLMAMLETAPSLQDGEAELSIRDKIRDSGDTMVSALEESETSVEALLATGRRMSPAALFPMDPYFPETTLKVGAMVRKGLADGHDFKGADLAGLNLRGLDFSGKDLSGTFFEQADLTGASFADCCLDGAVFTSARLEDADFSGSSLASTNFSGANLRSARLNAVRLSDATVMGADLSGASVLGATLNHLTLMDCKLDFADFSGAQVTDLTVVRGSAIKLRFCNAVFEQAVFLELPMSEADFSCAKMNRVAFTMVEAPEAVFSRAQLAETGFHGNCNLTATHFESVKATQTSWNNAVLEEALFLRADCRASLFNKCNLQSVDGRAASFKECRFLQSDLKYGDFCAANFFSASLSQSDLRLASLRHANLYATDFMEARLAGCDLTDANLTNTNIAQGNHAL